jgi:cation diffusion facilitator CzcD-associated flavoprotein CzcO
VTAAADRYDVIVVGGGQAGLALSYFLARDGRRFTILEAADAPAAAWRKRWDSLKLFTPVRYDSLPGLPFPGDPDSYPGRDEVVEYLARYAEHFNLPVQFNSEVLAVRAGDDAGFVVELRDRAYAADQVVVATGPFQTPRVPAIAEQRRDPRPDAQHRLPRAGRRSRRARAGGGRWEHGLPDRRRARGSERGASRRRLAADPAAAAAARP